MGFDLNVSVPALTVFVQGLLSFFSPCVLPLIPLYIGYLSGGTFDKNESGETVYNQKKVMLHTVFFVLGVSFAFFLLGLGVSAIGEFFNGKQMIFARIGGGIVILFGLYQLGAFGESRILSQEKKLPIQFDHAAMSPITALIMGFTFSFAWTPCVGPALTSVLMMTASAGSRVEGFLLIGLYTLGFVIPFLLVGIFTTKVLNLFRKHHGVVKYTVKIGGVLMILMGIMMITGNMNNLTGYLSRISADTTNTTTESVQTDQNTSEQDANENAKIAALDFDLKDQYGTSHSLAEYRGKVIFLNFWATWCPPCRNELPDIQKLYEEFSNDEKSNVVILGVAGPNYGQEGSVSDISDFLQKNGYTYPVLMDEKASLFSGYGIYSFPTTFMIDVDGNIYGYVTGQLTEEIMRDIIQQTLDGGKNTND